jgi:hypothetical protein
LLSNKEREAKKEEKKRRKTMAAQQESGLAQGRRLSAIETTTLTPLTPLSPSPIPAGMTDRRRHSTVYKTYSLPTADRHHLTVPEVREREFSLRRPVRGIDSTLQNRAPRSRRKGVVDPTLGGQFGIGPLSNFREQTIDDKFTAWIIRNKMNSPVDDSDLEGGDRCSYGITV